MTTGENQPVLHTIDIVHKGGEKMILENIQITLEPIGNSQFGIIVVRFGNNADEMKVLGKETDGVKATISTGDRIIVNVINDNDSNYLEYMPSGVTVKWTVSDTRTNGVIAKGEFIVPDA